MSEGKHGGPVAKRGRRALLASGLVGVVILAGGGTALGSALRVEGRAGGPAAALGDAECDAENGGPIEVTRSTEEAAALPPLVVLVAAPGSADHEAFRQAYDDLAEDRKILLLGEIDGTKGAEAVKESVERLRSQPVVVMFQRDESFFEDVKNHFGSTTIVRLAQDSEPVEKAIFEHWSKALDGVKRLKDTGRPPVVVRRVSDGLKVQMLDSFDGKVGFRIGTDTECEVPDPQVNEVLTFTGIKGDDIEVTVSQDGDEATWTAAELPTFTIAPGTPDPDGDPTPTPDQGADPNPHETTTTPPCTPNLTPTDASPLDQSAPAGSGGSDRNCEKADKGDDDGQVPRKDGSGGSRWPWVLAGGLIVVAGGGVLVRGLARRGGPPTAAAPGVAQGAYGGAPFGPAGPGGPGFGGPVPVPVAPVPPPQAPPARPEWLVDLGPAGDPRWAGAVPGDGASRLGDLALFAVRPVDREAGRTWFLPTEGAVGWAGWLEKKPARGEDAEPTLRLQGRDRGVLGVYDGSGGAGAEIARTLRDGTPITQAYVASRLVRDLTENWLAQPPAVRETTGLQPWIASGLEVERGRLPRAEVEIRGRMHRVLPTTMAVLDYRTTVHGQAQVQRQTTVEAYWAGDSRAYILTPTDGLQVLTRDDSREQDALELIRNDQPMDNMVSADRPFAVNQAGVVVNGPVVLVTATDGCFGYVSTPALFEYAVLRALLEATDLDDWSSRLLGSVSRFTGDDASFSMVALGFGGHVEMANAFGPRYDVLHDQHWKPFQAARQDPAGAEAERVRSWEAYRNGYEALLPPDPGQGRGR